MKRYTLRYERNESGWWVASVKGVRGCHTQGRTLEEARRRIRGRRPVALLVPEAGRSRFQAHRLRASQRLE